MKRAAAGVLVLALLVPAVLAATALYQSIQSPHGLQGIRAVQVEVFVNDNETGSFANKSFEKSLRQDIGKTVSKLGVKLKNSYDRVFVDVYVMPLENGMGDKLGHTLFMEVEVSRGGYFRSAEKKSRKIAAETVVWQSSGMASSGKSVKATKTFLRKMLKDRLKLLTTDWKKAKKLK